jgi:hypothetical protein
VAAGGSVTVGGRGIPRLQELAYLETVVTAVSVGHDFEGIRLAVADHIWDNRNSMPGADLPDPALYEGWRSDEKKFVRNVTDSLKELMRLGFVRKAILPSSGRSAYVHKDAKYDLTPAGKQWVETLSVDRRQAYEDLLPRLIRSHPGFECFLATVGAIGANDRGTFVVPCCGGASCRRVSGPSRRTARPSGPTWRPALASSNLGWMAEADEMGCR